MADAAFPLEILHHIIVFTAKEDDNEYSNMKSCALVCYGLFGFCQQLMFKAVEVDSSFSNAAGWDHPTLRLSSAGFVKALSGNTGSSLGKAIRKLSFVVSRADIRNAVALQQALKTVNHLEYLMITQGGLVTPLETRELDTIRKAFQHLLQLPTLSALCISDFPIFSVGPGLRAITLWASRPQNLDEFSKCHTTFSEKPPKLESITFHGYAAPALMQLLSCTRSDGTPVVDLSNLKRIAVHTLTRKTLGIFQSLASASLVGLEEVAFMAQETSDGDRFYGDHRISDAVAPFLKTLKRFTLDLPFTTSRADPVFTDFESEIGCIRESENCIEEIVICVSSPFHDGCLSEGGYYILDRVLSHQEGWTHLRHVSITFNVVLNGSRYGGRQPLDDALLRRRFKNLTKSKKIKFTLNCLGTL